MLDVLLISWKPRCEASMKLSPARSIKIKVLSGPILNRTGHTRNGKPVYSHVVITDRPKLVFISGQLSKHEDGTVVGKGDIRAQIRQVGRNLKLALDAAGATLEDVIKSNTYVTDYELYVKNADLRDQIG